MNKSNKSYEELLQELQELKAENASLKTAYNNDLSERKLTEEALSKSKEQLREILENSISVSYKRNLTTNKYDYISPAIFNILGYTSEEFKEFSIQNVLKIMYSEDITITNRQVTSNLGDVSKTNFNINYRLRHKNGEYRWLNDQFKVLRDNNGNALSIIGSVSDITERKNYEESIHQLRANYETFFNKIDDFLFVLDENGNIIHTNSTVSNRLGYTTEELVGQSVLMVHPVERREEAGRIVGEMLSGKVEFCPVPIVTKSGGYIPVETRVVRGIWNDKPVLFGVTKDISQLRLSEEKFSKLFKINQSACGLTDLNNQIYIEVNQAFYDLFGFEEKEVIGFTPFDLGIITHDSFKELLSKADSHGNFKNVEAVLKTKNDDLKHVVLFSENIYVQDKQFRFTVVHDITERKQAENALKYERQRLSLILEGTNAGTWEWNIQTGETVFNERWAGIIGYKLEEISPVSIETWMKFAHPDDLKVSGELLQRHFNGELDYYDFESRMKHKNGEWIWIYDRGKVHQWDENGNPLLMSGTHLDITERKKAEEEQRSLIEQLMESKEVNEVNLFQKNALIEELSENKEKLEQINSEKDKFFSIIAHDLRSPFNGFLGLTKMLVEEINDLSMRELQELSVNMKESASNLYKLLDNLLEWSRMQRGMIKFNPEICPLAFIAKEVLEIQSEVAKAKEIELFNIIPDGITITADISMLNTVLRNLISNALKFTPRGGKIEIGVDSQPSEGLKPSEGSTHSDGSVVYIKDSGIGMTAETILKLFKLDENVSQKGTEGEPSTGLGLLLCKDFIEKHGGRIWVESEVGKGSTFYFTIPYGK